MKLAHKVLIMHFSSHYLTLERLNRIAKWNPFVRPVFFLQLRFCSIFSSICRLDIFETSWIEFGIYSDMTTQIADDLIVNIERMRVNNRDRNIVTMHEWICLWLFRSEKWTKKQYKIQLKLPPAYLDQLFYLLNEWKKYVYNI